MELVTIQLINLKRIDNSHNAGAVIRDVVNQHNLRKLLNEVYFGTTLQLLIESKVVMRIPVSSEVFVTPKGNRYFKRAPKKLRLAVAKITGDVLDQIVESIR